MKPVRLPRTPWSLINQAFRILELASREERIVDIAQAYDVTNVVETRTLDASTATATDVANVLGTLIQDMQRGRKVDP